jgi:hypothetical protein
LEQINNHAVVPHHVTFPRFPGHRNEFHTTTSLPIWLFDIRLLEYPIKILVEAVEEESNEFLRIVLLIATELRCEALELHLEFSRRIRR